MKRRRVARLAEESIISRKEEKREMKSRWNQNKQIKGYLCRKERESRLEKEM